MAIAIGARLGSYEVVDRIGAGGMGEVYRARDTKLDRDVAIKILPDVFAHDVERRGRFEREARALAALNHPHIAQIYGLEEQASRGDTSASFIVMELVEGPTLAERLARSGRMSIDEAVAIARQIAEAFEAAHEQGIVHRDLKPANIKIRDDGTVKVLDFGLAKLVPSGTRSGEAHPAAVSLSPTLTAHATVAGVILGTAAYMAPEQARGKPADRRADIWAFGAVLYELLTGRRAFPGDEISDTLASVLKEDPDWSALPPDLSPSIRRVLRRCLEKDPRQRLSAIGDARLDLDERDATIERQPTTTTSHARWIVALAAGLAVGAVASWLVLATRRSAPAHRVTRFTILAADNTNLYPDSTTPVLSPDGRMVVLVTGASNLGTTHFTGLLVRLVDSPDARRLERTEGAVLPFWSPDSREIAFFSSSDQKLKKIAVDGGRIEEICDAQDGRGGTWNRAGVIVFAPLNSGPLMKVSASGGKPEAVTTVDAARGEGHRFPQFLPDGEHFVFASVPARSGAFDILVGSLDGMTREPLLTAESAPTLAEPGYLLFVRKGGLVAQRLDASRRRLVGEPVALPDVPGAVGDQFMAGRALSASTDATLTYLTDLPPTSKLIWFDQTGRQTRAIDVPPARYSGISLSRDARRAILIRWISPTMNDLWAVDLDRGITSRLTNATGQVNQVVWSPDGERVAFSNNPDGPRDIYITSALGVARAEPLHRSAALAKDPNSWSADGRFLVFNEMSPATNWDLWVLPTDGDRKPRPIVQTPFNDTAGEISPDGRWVTYVSDESGTSEVYVQPFPMAGRPYRVTTTGASQAWWRGDSQQLLILDADRTQVFVADVQPGSSFGTTPPRIVGRLPKSIVTIVATPDLKGFIALVNDAIDRGRTVTVVQNWTAALERR